MRLSSASARHSLRTGQPAHTVRARFCSAPSGNSSSWSPRHLAKRVQSSVWSVIALNFLSAGGHTALVNHVHRPCKAQVNRHMDNWLEAKNGPYPPPHLPLIAAPHRAPVDGLCAPRTRLSPARGTGRAVCRTAPERDGRGTGAGRPPRLNGKLSNGLQESLRAVT